MFEYFGYDATELLRAYGYWALLIGTFLEGETIVIVAGFLAQKGILYPPYIALAAFTGSFASDQFMFFLGRYKGLEIIRRFPSLERNVEKATSVISRYETALILGFRFLYGLRNITPILMGLSRVSRRKFFILNLIGAVVWACLFTAGGYFFGRVFTAVVHDIAHAEKLLIGGLTTLITGIWLYKRHKRKKDDRLTGPIVSKHTDPK